MQNEKDFFYQYNEFAHVQDFGILFKKLSMRFWYWEF